MITKWITAAAAASALSSGGVAEESSARARAGWNPTTSAVIALDRPYVRASSARVRILRIADIVRRQVARYADIDPRGVTAMHTLDELGVDAVARADVALGLEARFDVDIAESEAAAWQTVGNVVALVAEKLRARADAAII